MEEWTSEQFRQWHKNKRQGIGFQRSIVKERHDKRTEKAICKPEAGGDHQSYHVQITAYISGNVRRDLDNIQTTLLDCLIIAVNRLSGYLPEIKNHMPTDDNWKQIRSLSITGVKCEKGNEGFDLEVIRL